VIGRLVAVGALGVVAAKAYDLLVEGRLTLDVGRGRRLQPLGPVTWEIAAPRSLVFELIESPYRRTPRALAQKLQVLERGSDMVLAAHVTDVGGRKVTTVETVAFEPPARIRFRLVRGPVPHVAEVFELEDAGNGTELTWRGELGTDFGQLGERWGNLVARSWGRAVEASIAAVKSEAERRARET
jgi:Polyketide cyclase / dehydrase and lipid transport